MIRDLALLAARLAVGEGMAAHGAQKAFGWYEGPGPEKAAQMMESLGFRPGETYGKVASWNEIVSGHLIALGLGGPLGPALLISNMIVAQATVHSKNGFFAQKNGIEIGTLYAAAALTFAATDYGALSLDQVIGLRKPLSHPVFTALALAGAVAGAGFVLKSRSEGPEEPATPTYRGSNNSTASGTETPPVEAS